MQHTIKVTLTIEGSFWVGIFERNDEHGFAAARAIFGKEPTDPELYQYILANYKELKFSQPQVFKLVVKRKNPKRVQREVRREMDRAKSGQSDTTYAQDVLRIELEKNKLARKSVSKAEKESEAAIRFEKRQEKRKKKKSGH